MLEIILAIIILILILLYFKYSDTGYTKNKYEEECTKDNLSPEEKYVMSLIK